ncbi:hypothetical protein Mapa_015866 [Marchantia paleacea]|nr:hypothetical protein Mapa_015866 [Marchantia paleacea]
MAAVMCTEKEEEEIMDSKVWERLPDEILPQILLCLPWWSNLRLRAVSRSWKNLLSDPKFLAQSTPLPCARAPCCILRNSGNITIGDLNVQKWHVLRDFSATWDGFIISAANSGLFLMRGSDPSINFLVNPLNRTQRRLPPMPKLEDQLVLAGWHHPMTMKVEENPTNVKVVALQFGDGKLTRVFVYDLLRHSWDAVSDNFTSKNLRGVHCALLVEDDVYLLAASGHLFKVGGYQLIELPLPQDHHDGLVIKYIFHHRGSLMLGNGTWIKNSPHPVVDLWRFDRFLESWDKVASMPDYFASELDSSQALFQIDAEGDFVGFGCHNSKTLVLHNIVTSEWWSVACVDHLRCTGCSFLWQPRLDIVL